jgi:hypothetical protein
MLGTPSAASDGNSYDPAAVETVVLCHGGNLVVVVVVTVS